MASNSLNQKKPTRCTRTEWAKDNAVLQRCTTKKSVVWHFWLALRYGFSSCLRLIGGHCGKFRAPITVTQKVNQGDNENQRKNECRCDTYAHQTRCTHSCFGLRVFEWNRHFLNPSRYSFSSFLRLIGRRGGKFRHKKLRVHDLYMRRNTSCIPVADPLRPIPAKIEGLSQPHRSAILFYQCAVLI